MALEQRNPSMSTEGPWLQDYALDTNNPEFGPNVQLPVPQTMPATNSLLPRPEAAPRSPNTNTVLEADYDSELDRLDKHVVELAGRLHNYRRGHAKEVRHLTKQGKQMSTDIQNLKVFQGQIDADIKSLKSLQHQIIAKLQSLESSDVDTSEGFENTAASRAAVDQTLSAIRSLQSAYDQINNRIETITSQCRQVASQIELLTKSHERHAGHIRDLQEWSDDTAKFMTKIIKALKHSEAQIREGSWDE